MREKEIPKGFFDVNGREIKPGSVGRLSEKGRAEAPIMNEKYSNHIKDLKTVRFRIPQLPTGGEEYIWGTVTEAQSRFPILLKPEWIVIESD